MTAWSQSSEAAAMSISWPSKMVSEVPTAFAPSKSFPCDLRYAADPDLHDGWLFTPSTMDQKWAIAYRDGSVLMIRSWTGVVVAAGKARRDQGQLVIERVDVANGVLGEFGESIPTFDWMLRAHALGQVLPLPVNEEGARRLEAAPLEVFTVFGHMAVCAATTWAPPPPPKPLRATTDLLVAVRLGRADRVAQLAAEGAALNARSAVGGFTPLHLAAVKGDLALTRQLLDLGADPNVPADRNASVVVTALVHKAPVEVMKLLVARGADVRVANADGFGALHALAEMNRPDPLAWLLSLGLDLEARTKLGLTPLHIAAALGHVEALEALLDAGADIGVTSPSGQTARDIAKAEGKGNTFDVLVRRSP
jgi:Ankyrin repeats (3 copies)/Ankyrin repeat